MEYLSSFSSSLSSMNLKDEFVVASTTFTLTALLPSLLVRTKHSLNELSQSINNQEIRKKRSLLHEKFNPSKLPSDIDYIVIGSGMGGLTTAAILSRLGRKVVVLEQHHDVAGGGTHMFDLKGYVFDSGLHYTVPWSGPLFALTCLKKPKDCIPFDLMLEKDGTIDKVYLVEPDEKKSGEEKSKLYRMRYHETHFKDIYDEFPEEKAGIDRYLAESDNAMLFVKIFIFARLLPRWLQRIYWSFLPSSVLRAVQSTASDLLPQYTSNKRLASLFSSMWIDTGARPDKATFMLTASVFRGISMEGGCYPRGGSTEMAKELVTVIESNGGKVFIRADVDEIVYDVAALRVTGVRLKGGLEVKAKKGVVSATGYHNTMNNLVRKEVTSQFQIPRSLPVKQSAGFVMANIGINCSAETIGATKANTWHIPLNSEGDIFQPTKEYFDNPFGNDRIIPAFITFPSVKDTSYNVKNKTSCQMLFMAEYDWFNQYLPNAIPESNPYETYQGKDRSVDYEMKCKEEWKKRALAIFLRYFPKAADHIEVMDISTPLSIQHYLRATHGAAVGLDSPPQRFLDPEVRDALDPITNIPGLALTGQDTVICGVTLCQLAGAITAFRLEGFWATMKILFQSILLGNS